MKTNTERIEEVKKANFLNMDFVPTFNMFSMTSFPFFIVNTCFVFYIKIGKLLLPKGN